MKNTTRHIAAILITAALVAAPAASSARGNSHYRIELSEDTGDLLILVTTSSGPAVIVALENKSAHDAVCIAGFTRSRHRPSADETLKATVAAGGNATLTYPTSKLGGHFSTVFIDLRCTEKNTAR
jgi:hypothetical protein